MNRRQILTLAAGATAGHSLAASAPSARAASPPPLRGRSKRILVLGGTRFLGPAVVREALLQGHQVTLFNRGLSNPWLFPAVERRVGNRFPELAPGLSALSPGEWDMVLDLSAQYPRLVEASAKLLRGRVGHYVLVSSIAVYGDYRRGGIDEASAVLEGPADFRELPDLYETDWHTYGRRKVLCERAVQAAYGERCTIVRAGQLIGQSVGGQNKSDGRWYWPARLWRDRVVGAPGDGSDPVQPVDVADLAAFLIAAGSDRREGVFNLVGPSVTFGQYLTAAAEVVGSQARIVWLGREASRRIFNVPMFTPFETLPGFGTISNRRALAAGAAFRPLRQSITADWLFFRENLPADYDFAAAGTGLSPVREAELIAAAGASAGGQPAD